MWIDRQVEPLLLRRAATRPVVVLTGARQTGKTSLVRRLFPDHAYVTLDLPSEAEQAERRGGWDLHFWRDQSREADFLLHRAGAFHLADAKWTEHPGGRDAKALFRIAQALPPGSVRTMSIFCRAINPYPLGSGGVNAVPLDAPEALAEWA